MDTNSDYEICIEEIEEQIIAAYNTRGNFHPKTTTETN